MRSSARRALSQVLILLCIAVAIFAGAAPGFAQTPAKQPAAKPAGGSVSGRVTIKDKPAGGILVVLRKGEPSSPYEPVTKAITEPDGTYRITGIAPGSYAVVPTALAYVAAESPSAARKSVVIAEDENVDGINFSLVRGGVITGRITDVEGRPVIQQQVELYRAEPVDPKAPAPPPQRSAPSYPMRSVQTDDRGVYRMFGLPAGHYKVSAGRSENSRMQMSLSPFIYAQVFHPHAKDPAEAKVIEVSEGSEATNIDITLGSTLQIFSVSGRLINTDNGAPVPQMRFGLHRLIGDSIEYVNLNAMSDARGEFIMEGITPGRYGVFLFANVASDLRVERTTFEVIDQDVTGLVIKFAKGATVTGTVVLESEDKAAHRKLLDMRVFGYVERFGGTGNSSSSPIGPDGSFRVTGLPPGMADFQIFPTGGYMPAGFVVVRIERDGVATPRLELKDAEIVTGVKVFVRYGSASVRGVVSFENGTPPPGLRVVIRLSKPGGDVRYNRNAEVDSRGHFLIDNLPAGVYELRPAVFGFSKAGVLDIKKEVSLTEGSVANVILSIDVSLIKL